MKSRLQLLVVLLFIGIAGVIFVFSGGGNEDSTGLEIVEDISGNKSGSIVDIKSSTAETDKDSPKEAKSDNLKKEGLQGNEKLKENQKIFIHICGAVKNEGVYQVEADARVVDVIRAAGGLTKEAASSGINQAKQLEDGMQVYVPTKKEVSKAGTQIPGLQKEDLQNSASVNSQNSAININTATKEELMKLKGVGEAKAVLIITYRENNGGFKEITDLMKIKGIKQKFFDKIKDNICV
jgi:hypothetical protein